MTVSEQKEALRRQIRAKRREIGEVERELDAAAVASRLGGISRLTSSRCILAYMPMKNELDILPAVEMFRRRGVRVAFPLCIENGGLRLFVPADENGFVTGSYGILEPDVSTAEEISAEELDAIILPAIGFDLKGYRLGQGGGYYDRLLARTDCFCAAVGFDCQLVPEVPVEGTDMRVDAVITPGTTLIF